MSQLDRGTSNKCGIYFEELDEPGGLLIIRAILELKNLTLRNLLFSIDYKCHQCSGQEYY